MDDFLREYERVLYDANGRLADRARPARGPRRASLVRAGGVAVAAAITAALILAFGVLHERPSEERSAAPVATVTFAPPAPSIRVAPPPAAPTGPFRVARPRAIAPETIAADPDLRDTISRPEEVVRAWSVPALKGHVYLAQSGADWCLSAPDPASPMPDIERGMGCNPGEYGASVTIGSNFVAVLLDDTVKHPLLRLRSGKRRVLTPDKDGLVALVNVPNGASITLYDKQGKGRTDRFPR